MNPRYFKGYGAIWKATADECLCRLPGDTEWEESICTLASIMESVERGTVQEITCEEGEP